MSKHETLLRYQKIIGKLRTFKESTFEEISDYLKVQSELHEFNLVISQRTFQRDLNEIRSLYQIDIQCDRSRGVYFIAEENADYNDRLMEAFDMVSALKMSQDLTRYIYFEKRKPQGTHHFYGLLHAIRNRLVIDLSHQKFEFDEPTKRFVEPYGLKESKGRWYLLAKEIGKDKVKTFGLDRILDFDITNKHFSPPEKYNANEEFRYCFGVINFANLTPQEIVLSFDPEQGKYLKSYPLHETQTILADNEDELRIRLFLLATHDLVMEILSYAEYVTVISRKSLIKEVKQHHGKAYKQYLKK